MLSKLGICIAVIVYFVKASQDCGDGFVSVDVERKCTNSTCLGECRDENTCCLERCFAGSYPSTQELEGCDDDDDVEGTCSKFANQTECLAGNLNKSTDVCWKHTIYYISTHPVMTEISGFNPVNCPCESGRTRIDGECHYSQCVNSSYCLLENDTFRNSFVCCLDEAIFPLESDCGNEEKLDEHFNKNGYVSTMVECEKECKNGLCRMTDPNRFPACCRRTRKIVKQPDDESLHGSVIAVIITLVIVLLIAVAFGGYYVYSRRKHDKSRKIDNNTASIEITGLDEMIGSEQAWNEDIVHGNVAHKTNGYFSGREVESYQEPDEFDHMSTSEFDQKYSNVNDNASYRTDNEQIDDVESRRTGSSTISTIFRSNITNYQHGND